MRLRNRYTGEILEATVTPLNGAHIIRQGTVELHRGNAATARAYLENMLERGIVWDLVTD